MYANSSTHFAICVPSHVRFRQKVGPDTIAAGLRKPHLELIVRIQDIELSFAIHFHLPGLGPLKTVEILEEKLLT